jgi:hypothetical protein
MLTASALGMAGYGLYSIGLGIAAWFGYYRLEGWVGAALAGFGALLLVAAPFVRVRFPGAVPLAVGAMLALQALSLHNDVHFYGRTVPALQAARAAFGVIVTALALAGSRQPERTSERDPS